MPPVHGLSALDDLGAEVIGLAEEVAIIAREPVRLVAGFPLGEAVLTFPVLLDVAARALDEMLRELDSPRFGERGRVPLAKVLAHQGEERTKRELDSAMWRCGQKDQVLVLLPRDLAHQLVALMLALVAFRRRGRAMGFIDNHEVGTIEQEEMAVPVALQQFPPYGFSLEKTLVLISHFANPSRKMLLWTSHLNTWTDGVARHGACSR